MKKLMLFALLSVVWLSTSQAQYRTERTGYEGDYFSLEGALDLFKESSTLRNFERRLNTKDNWVNNLDLNYDGRTDYIRVEHRRQGNYHAIILQAVVDRYDIQDVAVIELEIIGRREAVLQIIGDEDLYGEEVIVEPVEGYSDSRSGYHRDYGDFVNVYYWRPVQYLLDRQYQVYVSPYRWQYYPTWWNPWVQVSWNVFRPRIVVYVNRYHIVRRHRVVRVHHFYRPYRTYCNTVVQRANRVRVSSGRQPIYRPDPPRRPARGYGNDGRRGDVVERPRTTSPRPNISRTDPGLISKKRTTTPVSRGDARTSTPRTDQISRKKTQSSDVANPGRARSTDRNTTNRQNTTINKRTTPASDQKRSRTTTTIERSSRSRTSTAPSTSTNRAPTRSRTKVTTPSRSGSRSSSSVDQRSRTTTTRSSTPARSRTSTRATTPARKPSVSSSKKTAPSSKSKATQSRSSSSKSSSRSRRGGGE